MTCSCGSRANAQAKNPGRRIKSLSVRQQNEAAMRVVLGEKGEDWYYTNPRGRVRWLGVRWAGVPAPIRWYLWARGKLTHPKLLDGCGCIVALKAWWVRVFH